MFNTQRLTVPTVHILLFYLDLYKITNEQLHIL
jgi:hypothetical protein